MTLRMNGSTSGYVEIDSPAVGGNNTIQLPTSNGSANQFLKNGSTAGTLGWSSMVEDSSGRVLIGTSSANGNALFQISGDNDNYRPQILRTANDEFPSGIIIAKARGSSNQVVSNNDWLGVVAFRGGSGTGLFDGAYVSAYADAAWGNNDYPTRLVFATTRDGTASPVERMRIWGSTASTDISIIGSPSVATDSGNFDFRTSGLTRSWVIATNTSNFYIADADFSNYAYLSQNPTAWQWASDARLKENITDLDYGIDVIKQIKAKRFNFIGDSVSTIGFIAQELKEVIPEAVSGEEIPYGENDTPQEKAQKSLGIGKETLVPVLVKALQEAITKIETLESANASQLATIAAMEARLTALEAAQ